MSKGLGNEPEEWEELIQRGKIAAAGAIRKLVVDTISHIEDWQKPPPFRGSLLTEGEYETMLDRQNGVCAICKGKPKGERLAVDHVHGTEKVRGLLCGPCNRALGLFKDDPVRLAVAIEYLKLGAGP